jgi:PleD family two-component response regulator
MTTSLAQADYPNTNLLIVDDNPDNLRLLGELLNRQGYRVRPVPGGYEAFQVLEVMQPDLILLDINMPGMNGFEICERLKINPATRDIPVIFISAADAVEDKVKGFEMGSVDYITKPFHEKEILIRINTHLRLHFLKRSLEEKVAELERANARVRELSIRDELTGLYNRRYFNEEAPHLLAHARRYQEPLSFMIGDIDFFKIINDRFSHAIGDQVLRQIARVIISVISHAVAAEHNDVITLDQVSGVRRRDCGPGRTAVERNVIVTPGACFRRPPDLQRRCDHVIGVGRIDCNTHFGGINGACVVDAHDLLRLRDA